MLVRVWSPWHAWVLLWNNDVGFREVKVYRWKRGGESSGGVNGGGREGSCDGGKGGGKAVVMEERRGEEGCKRINGEKRGLEGNRGEGDMIR